MDKILDRLKEPSTYGGLAATTLGVGALFKINEAPQVADVIGQAAPSLSTGDWMTGGMVLAFGLASIFMKERK